MSGRAASAAEWRANQHRVELAARVCTLLETMCRTMP